MNLFSPSSKKCLWNAFGFVLRDVKVRTESKEEAGCSKVSGNMNGQVKPTDGEDFFSLGCFHCAWRLRVLVCHSGSRTTQ